MHVFDNLLFIKILGSRTKVNSSHIERKILNGKSAKEDEHTYIASLQLNGEHVCNSVLFQKDFLLTAGACASRVLVGMIKENKTGTAVLGNSNLRKGERAIILEITHAYHSKCSDSSVGVVMVGVYYATMYSKYVNILKEIPSKKGCIKKNALCILCLLQSCKLCRQS